MNSASYLILYIKLPDFSRSQAPAWERTCRGSPGFPWREGPKPGLRAQTRSQAGAWERGKKPGAWERGKKPGAWERGKKRGLGTRKNDLQNRFTLPLTSDSCLFQLKSFCIDLGQKKMLNFFLSLWRTRLINFLLTQQPGMTAKQVGLRH